MKCQVASLPLLLVVVSCVHSNPLEEPSAIREKRGGYVPPYCGGVCMMACPFGKVLDARGCPICKCRDYPCPQIQCPIPCPNGYQIRNGCPSCYCR